MSRPENPLKVLLVEDDSQYESALRGLLKGCELRSFTTSKDLLDSKVFDSRWDLLLLDQGHANDPAGTNTRLSIPELRQRLPGCELVVQSGMNDVNAMRECIGYGATRFLLKDQIQSELPLLLARLKEFRSFKGNLDELLIGESAVMTRLKEDLFTLRFESAHDVLVEGETGTGKELCARALHVGGPFVAVNAAAIPAELFEAEFFGAEKGAYTGSAQSREGLLEAAGTGTLFLDELQALSLVNQAKLLRVLETRSYLRVGASRARNFLGRIVAASNENLKSAVERGAFREDLYYRISSLYIQVPPLRLRGRDAALLAEHFLNSFSEGRGKKFAAAALTFMCEGYDWPGNVRELKNFVRKFALRSQIPILDLPELKDALARDGEELKILASGKSARFALDINAGLDENLRRLEYFLLSEAIKGHKPSRARELLKLSKSRFYDRLRAHKIVRASELSDEE